MEKNGLDLLKEYIRPCLIENNLDPTKKESIEELPNIKIIRKILGKTYTKEDVRDYFLNLHNTLTHNNKAYSHLAIPYKIFEIGESVKTKIISPFFNIPEHYKKKEFNIEKIGQARKKGILEEIVLGGFIITHCGFIVDYANPEELSKYETVYENFG